MYQYFYHRKDIPSWLHQSSLKYGDIFELYFGSDKCLMISDLRIVERVMSPAKDGNYFVRVATRKGLDELQKSNNGILFNEDFNSWSYIRKVLIRATVSPSALRFAVTTLNNVFHDLEKLWDSLIEEQGQFLHDEQEKSVEIDFATWAKRIFAETTMLLIVGRQPNLLSTYYNRITNKNNIQKNSNEEFLDRLAIASDCVQYYVSVPSFILLRIRPVTATISRFSTHSDQIDEYKIPLSTQLAINMMGTFNAT
ncbi:8984_t:CDS:2 [Entrophospora sp. SA101]|nr:8982_t:CDS:2 [Entrophospora sp. SA101]CAJ0826529.1 8984_t:CDS:2 [Entrophospora sp. SA101]